MANFKIPQDGEDISSFDLPLKRDIALVQWGGDFSGNKLSLSVSSGSSFGLIDVKPTKLPSAFTEFILKGLSAPSTFKVSAYVPGTSNKFSEDLTVNVLPSASKHPGYSVDLISSMAIKGDAKKLRLYSQMFKDPVPVLQQDTRPHHFNCGDVAANYGKKLFGKDTSTTYNAYYNTPTSDKMDDLRFEPSRMSGAIGRIKSLLDNGTSVRVWIVDNDGFSKFIQPTDPTHFVTIVGYGANKFLYIDPWPDGSNFPYNGGMYKPRVSPPTFFGEFEYDPANMSLGIHDSAQSHGSMHYRIVAGP